MEKDCFQSGSKCDDDDDDDDDDDNEGDGDDDHDADDYDANDTVTYTDDVTGYVSDDPIWIIYGLTIIKMIPPTIDLTTRPTTAPMGNPAERRR